MPGIETISPKHRRPAKPPTDVRASHKKAKGEWVLVDAELGRDAWLEIDDEHVHPLEMME